MSMKSTLRLRRSNNFRPFKYARLRAPRPAVQPAVHLLRPPIVSSVRFPRPSGDHSSANGQTPSERAPSRGAVAVASQPLAAASAAGARAEVGAALWQCARERPSSRGTPSTQLCDHAFTPPLARNFSDSLTDDFDTGNRAIAHKLLFGLCPRSRGVATRGYRVQSITAVRVRVRRRAPALRALLKPLQKKPVAKSRRRCIFGECLPTAVTKRAA
jgi:hypothetical protein